MKHCDGPSRSSDPERGAGGRAGEDATQVPRTRRRAANRSPEQRSPDAPAQVVIRPQSCDEMLVLLPRMLGFQPVDSLVVAVIDGVGVEGVVRVDLEGFQPLAFREVLEPLLASCRTPRVLLAGYGERARVDRALREAAMAFSPEAIVDQLGTDAARWWCLDGPSFPLEVPDADWPAGLSTMIPDRAGLVARAARPCEQEQRRLTTLLDTVLARHGDLDTASAVGRTRELVARGMNGARSEDLLVELGLLTTNLRCRDEAWVMISEGDATPALELWLDVSRHAIDLVAPASLCMAATAAWRLGQWVLMGECLAHALRADPDYSLAHLLASALQRGVPAGVWQQAMTDHARTAGD